MSYPQDARWFLERIDARRDQVRFMLTERDTLSAQPFLDHRWRTEAAEERLVPLGDLERDPPPPAKVHFLWHTSFCGSTLLAACLDHPGRCLSLREPWALVHLADLKRAGHLMGRPKLAPAVFALMGRRFDPEEQVLIKPSNAANTLVAEAAAQTSGKMLMLYSGQRQFLLSMVKNGGSQATFVREMLLVLLADRRGRQAMAAENLLRLTDLQAAALVWQIQMAHFRQALDHLGVRAASLDAAAFLEDPKRVLSSLDDFYDLQLGAEVIEAILQGPKLKRDAKRGGSFDTRAGDVDAIESLMGADIDRAIDWSRKATGEDQAQPLPRPLLS